MKLTMLTGLGGPKLNLVKGDPHSCEIDEAARLVRSGFATTTNEKDEQTVADRIAELEEDEAQATSPAKDDDDEGEGGDGDQGGANKPAPKKPAPKKK